MDENPCTTTQTIRLMPWYEVWTHDWEWIVLSAHFECVVESIVYKKVNRTLINSFCIVIQFNFVPLGTGYSITLFTYNILKTVTPLLLYWFKYNLLYTIMIPLIIWYAFDWQNKDVSIILIYAKTISHAVTKNQYMVSICMQINQT